MKKRVLIFVLSLFVGICGLILTYLRRNEESVVTYTEHERFSYKSTGSCSHWDCEINIPLKQYNLRGLSGVELELTKYKRDMEMLMRNEMYDFCERYNDREKMLGEGTRKPVKIHLHDINDKRSRYLGIFDQLETLDRCTVPCVASRKELWGDVDAIVHFSPLREPFWIDHNKTRPYKALVSVENKYVNPDLSVLAMMDQVDLLIHHYPFSDIPTFIVPLYQKWMDEELSDLGMVYKPGNGDQFRTDFMRNFKGKRKRALGVDFISRGCDNPKKRDKFWYRNEYLKIVQNEIKTDNYGSCGENKKEEPKYVKKMFVNKILVAKDYKFFFCFENSMSYNYVSEKLTHGMRTLYSLPVYFGAPNVLDFFNHEVVEKGYKLFINAAEFPNPHDLVEYLKYLNQNDTAYLEYFQWRFDGLDALKQSEHYNWMRESVDSKGRAKGWICRLCEKIYYGENLCHHEEYPDKPVTTRVNLQ